MKYLILLLCLASCKLPKGSTDESSEGPGVEFEEPIETSYQCYEVSEDGYSEIIVNYSHTEGASFSTLSETIECEAYEDGVQVGYDNAEFGFCTFSMGSKSYSIEFNNKIGQITEHGISGSSWQLSCEQI